MIKQFCQILREINQEKIYKNFTIAHFMIAFLMQLLIIKYAYQ